MITLEALHAGKAADVQMRVLVERPNRWGHAFEAGTSGRVPVELHDELFATVTERSITFRRSC
jgi:hypothetical protein